MAKNKNRLDFQAHLSRHPHDITAGYTSTLVPGPIVPQYFHVLNPGDTIYYTPYMFARLRDMVTAFLGEVDIHLDSFFVPLQMLYLPFGQVYALTDDVVSSSFKNLVSRDAFPLISCLPYRDAASDWQSFENLNNISNASFYSLHDECFGKRIQVQRIN